MRYFKEFDENGNLIAIGAGDALNGVDITQEEYETLEAELETKWAAEAEAARNEREEAERQEQEAIAAAGAEEAAQEAMDILTGASEVEA